VLCRSRTRSAAGDVADFDKQSRSVVGPAAAQLEQGGAGLGEQLLELFVRGLGAFVVAFQIADEFGGDSADRFAGRVSRTHLRQQRASLHRR
jgi:hypothetical protein